MVAVSSIASASNSPSLPMCASNSAACRAFNTQHTALHAAVRVSSTIAQADAPAERLHPLTSGRSIDVGCDRACMGKKSEVSQQKPSCSLWALALPPTRPTPSLFPQLPP
eukprot:6174168-Pleurochrysis_carterae.AAC.3